VTPNTSIAAPASAPARGWLVILIAATTALTVLGAFQFLRWQSSIYRKNAGEQISAVADLKVREISTWYHERLGDAEHIQDAALINGPVARLLVDRGDAEARQVLLRWMMSLQRRFHYESVAILSTNLDVVLATSPPLLDEVSPTVLALAPQALQRREVIPSYLYRDPAEGAIAFSLVVPLFSPDASLPLGVVALTVDPGEYLYPLIRAWPSPSKSAETLLVRADGDSVVFLNELRHQSNVALRLSLPVTRADLPAALAVRGVEAVVRGQDYRGVAVMAATRRIPETPWYLVSKVDLEEVLEPLQTVGIVTSLLGGTFLAGVWLALSLNWRTRESRFMRRELDMLEDFPALVRRSGSNGQCNYCNRTWLDFRGASSEMEQGVRWQLGIHPEDRPGAVATFHKSLEARSSYTIEYRLRRSDGQWRWILEEGRPFEDLAGRFAGTISTCFDLTDRKTQEEQLRLQATALSAAANAIVITDSTGRIEWVNPAFTVLTGYTLEEVRGENPRVLKSGSHPTEFYKEMWETVSAGCIWQGEMTNRRKDGSIYTEEMTITPVREPNGQTRHFIAIKQDVTEKKQLEARFLRAQRLQSIGTLVSGIAHELNNILAPVLLAPSMFDRSRLSEEERGALDLMTSSGQRAASIIKHLLSFTRAVQEDRTLIHVQNIIIELNDGLSHIFPKSININLEVTPGLWPLVGDKTRIYQILLNLCLNARDAMPDGGTLQIHASNIEIDEAFAKKHPDAEPGRFVLLQVRDTGTGIAPDVLEQVFDPFFTTKEIGQGTGLGLSTVLGIVKSHGGFIAISSEVGHGTEFQVYLPATPDAVVATLATAAATEPAPQGHGECILVVDDEAAICEVLRSTLTRNGYTVLTSTNGEEALQRHSTEAGRVALVVTDLLMPGMDGVQFVQALQRLQPDVKVICCSGTVTDNGIAEMNALGVHRILPKPCDIAELLTAVSRALNEA
jgi:PAS domain S-box-containing protein